MDHSTRFWEALAHPPWSSRYLSVRVFQTWPHALTKYPFISSIEVSQNRFKPAPHTGLTVFLLLRSHLRERCHCNRPGFSDPLIHRNWQETKWEIQARLSWDSGCIPREREQETGANSSLNVVRVGWAGGLAGVVCPPLGGAGSRGHVQDPAAAPDTYRWHMGFWSFCFESGS